MLYCKHGSALRKDFTLGDSEEDYVLIDKQVKSTSGMTLYRMQNQNCLSAKHSSNMALVMRG